MTMAAWIKVNRSRKAGWQVTTLCGSHRLCAESDSAACGIANGRTRFIRKPPLRDPCGAVRLMQQPAAAENTSRRGGTNGGHQWTNCSG
jgi:hypothetical protein